MVAIMEKIEHIPVMCNEVLESLNLRPGDHVLDGTMGLGGHSKEILKRISPNGFLIGVDRDADALAIAKENLSEYAGRTAFVQSDFRFLDKVLDDLGIKNVNAILLDLGVSSYQLETPERGFSIRGNGPLDMRMDRGSFISAYDLVNSLSTNEISMILKNFGEERFHRRIADHLVRERVKHPIESTEELKRIITSAIPRQYQNEKIHPATRSFQAFRIAVNRELEALEEALDKCVNCLCAGGRIGVISFHSLEDRIVKTKFNDYAKKEEMMVVTKKPLFPSESEINKNPRARSARLRVAQKKS